MTGREERMHNVEVRNQELITQYTELMQSFYFSLSKLSAKTKRQYLSQIHVTFTGIYGKGYTDADILGTDMDKINKYFTSRRSVVNEAIISQQLYALNKFFNYLVRSERIKKNPVDIKELKPVIPEKERIVYLDAGQGKAVMNAIKNGVGSNNAKLRQKKWTSRDLLIFSIMFCKGIRVSTVIDMNVEDIDFTTHTLKTVSKREKTMNFPLTPDDEMMIKAWLHDREDILKQYGASTQALFITQYHGEIKRMTSNGVYVMIKKYTSAIGCEVSPHKLRSSFGTLFQEVAQDLALTQEAMGHANIATTRRYVPKDTARMNEIMATISENMLN